MKFEFYKMQSTGNDFIVLDGFKINYQFTSQHISNLCHRQFGIGADGFMIIEKSTQADFYMKFYNADGQISSFCGNGSRAAAFFYTKIIFENPKPNIPIQFEAADGRHFAEVNENMVKIKMKNVEYNHLDNQQFIVNTGSPHLIMNVDDNAKIDVYTEGKKIRNLQQFKKAGINVNFVTIKNNDLIFNRTYERGVENETLSCGTGNVAAAIYSKKEQLGKHSVKVSSLGGDVVVELVHSQIGSFENIYLMGPTEIVFKGEINLDS
ncbi:MAG: diaminopimelate epimerase [Alphaproteobacteria bacterium]|nr:diaminopimelate epimerase [Alphaproteobacteria bacterium]